MKVGVLSESLECPRKLNKLRGILMKPAARYQRAISFVPVIEKYLLTVFKKALDLPDHESVLP